MSETTAPPPKPRSDLGIRTISGVVIMLIAAAAIWIDGWPLAIFVALLTAGLAYEWSRLVAGFPKPPISKIIWNVIGTIYIGFSVWTFIWTNDSRHLISADGTMYNRPPYLLLSLLCVVIATDVGAYIAGRTFGGAKIAPRISPSKTWSGLFGGMICAGTVWVLFDHWTGPGGTTHGAGDIFIGPILFVIGAVLAIFAQAGDFFESWMKRRANVKDSGALIPGHGGLLDRLDGLLAVLTIYGLFNLALGEMTFYFPI